MKTEAKDLEAKVFDVCEKLQKQGEKVSVRRVLAEIDEVSSSSTIHPHYKNWVQQQEQQIDEVISELQASSSFMHALASDTRQIIQKANEKERADKEQYRDMYEDASREMHVMQQKVLIYQSGYKKILKEKEAMKHQIDATQSSISTEVELVQANSDRLVSKYKQQAEAANENNVELKSQLLALNESYIESNASSKVYERQVKQQSQQIEVLIAKNDKLQDRLIELEKLLARATR